MGDTPFLFGIFVSYPRRDAMPWTESMPMERRRTCIADKRDGDWSTTGIHGRSPLHVWWMRVGILQQRIEHRQLCFA